MWEFLTNLFSSDLMPHGFCYLWKPEIVWLHVISDSIIALSYFTIPAVLLYFVRRRPDLPFHWMFVMFGLFILGCGASHLMEVWTLWHGTYRLAGVVKAITAGASVVTAVLIVRLVPQAIALPSPDQLRRANADLAREVDDRRRAEAALQQARDQLELRVRERTAELMKVQSDLAHAVRVTTMGELAASIAHEVNQPLAAAMTNAHAGLRWLAADPPNLVEGRGTLERICRDTRRASEVVERIRGLLKKRLPQPAPLDVNELVHEVLALTRGALDANRIAVSLALEPSVPPIRGDRVQFQQVILNLVMNGLDAMHDVMGRPRMLLLSTGILPSGEVALTVRDSGPCVDPGVFERLFEPFFTTKAGGMGMGLSVSRAIVERHGGQLWATTDDAPGLVFHVLLPGMA
jgi:C4-dicarboxylate-specific signal transduction histidine kinase